MIRRREFIAGLGGGAAWPLAARAHQGNRVRRIGVLMFRDENDPVLKTRVSAFTGALPGLGWADGRNVRMDLRWGGGHNNRVRALAQELVGLQPDIILASGTAVTVALQRETRTIPIVSVKGGRSSRQRHRPATQPTGREHHRLRPLRDHAGRQVA
jgi:putative ABC transport system substrate-binding protein